MTRTEWIEKAQQLHDVWQDLCAKVKQVSCAEEKYRFQKERNAADQALFLHRLNYLALINADERPTHFVSSIKGNDMDIDYTLRDVHISEVRPGDTVAHNGELKTVGNYDIKDGFMGTTLFGDSYRLGKVFVKVADIKHHRKEN